jgi:hypothetical protein
MRLELELTDGYGVLLVITEPASEPPQAFAETQPSVNWGTGCFAIALPMQYGRVVIDIGTPSARPAAGSFWSHELQTQQGDVVWTLTTLLGRPLARMGLAPRTSSRVQLAFEEGTPPVLTLQFEMDALDYVEAVETPGLEPLSPELEGRLFPTEAYRPRRQ